MTEGPEEPPTRKDVESHMLQHTWSHCASTSDDRGESRGVEALCRAPTHRPSVLTAKRKQRKKCRAPSGEWAGCLASELVAGGRQRWRWRSRLESSSFSLSQGKLNSRSSSKHLIRIRRCMNG